MPTTNEQSVSAHTFPEIGPEVKRVGNWIGSATYSSVLPHQDAQRLHASFQKERPFEGSNTESDSKGCQTLAESDNQDEMMNFKPPASAPNYPLLGFGKPSYASRSATDVFKNVQPVSQMAYTSSQGGSTFRETPQVLGSKRFNPSRVESSYEMPKFSTVGSSKIFAVQAPKPEYGHMTFKPQDTKDSQSTSISSQTLHQRGSSQESQSSGEIQTSSRGYGPILMGAPVHSGGPKYTNAKPAIVSSGPIVFQSGERTQGLGSYSKHPNFVKPSNVDSNQYATSQIAQTSSAALNVNSQSNKLLNVPVYYSTRGGQTGAGKPLKQSGNCRDSFGQDSIASSGEIHLRAPEGAERSNLLPHFQSQKDVWQPRKPQKTFNIGGPPQIGSPVYSVSGSQPNQIFRPMHPTRSGVQLNVAKSSIASSGEIGMMHVPANVQSRTQSNNPQIASKPQPIFQERKVTFPPGQAALQYQLYEARQNTRNVQPATGNYASPPQSAYQVLSSKGKPYKPGTVPSKPLIESRVSATKPSISESNEISAVRVRHNKLPISSFGILQDQWASGGGVGGSSAYSSALQGLPPPNYLGQRRGQNVQTPVMSSVPQYQSSKGVQIQSSATQNLGSTTHDTTIPNEFGKGVIRRIYPTIFRNYKPGLIQMQHS